MPPPTSPSIIAPYESLSQPVPPALVRSLDTELSLDLSLPSPPLPDVAPVPHLVLRCGPWPRNFGTTFAPNLYRRVGRRTLGWVGGPGSYWLGSVRSDAAAGSRRCLREVRRLRGTLTVPVEHHRVRLSWEALAPVFCSIATHGPSTRLTTSAAETSRHPGRIMAISAAGSAELWC
jgi:hypothetical protein